MGKNRTAQRTKGNVKPSSSGRSAELLTSSGNLNFVGFSAFKSHHLTQDAEDRVDGMLSMVMKKMQKRDATTKLKAVQEFKDLCEEKDKEALIGILPFWPRLYNKLALDIDRRVREATQEANAKLIEKVKREIAPYLRNIMSVWLISQCDVYAPAASAARNAFSGTFPQAKQSEALLFCREEVLQCIKDCLLEQTAQSLSDPNATSEEKENKYILVVTGSLRGMKLFLNTLSADNREKVLEEVSGIVHDNKFWKFPKNKISQIRVAWYELVSTLIHTMPEAFKHLENKLGNAVLGSLAESDPSVAPAVWEAALHYVAGFEDCWNNVDIHKVVLPELWTLLKGGGTGNASLLFPCLLPFLSKLPVESIKQKQNFFTDFFSSIRKSLFLEDVRRSTIECNAVVTAFMECLQYVCLHADMGEDEIPVINDLISNQLLPLIERSFTTNGSHLPVSTFYPMLGKTLLSFESHVQDGKSRNVKGISEALPALWNKINGVCMAVLESEHLQQNADLVFLAYFFHCLFDPQNFLDKKHKKKVAFSDCTPEREGSPSPSRVQNVSESHLPRTELFSCALNVCKVLCQKLQNNLDAHHLKLLTEVLSAARSCKLFQELLKKLSISENGTVGSVLFFEKVVFKWIHEASGSDTVMENLMDIIVVIGSCLDVNSSLKILHLCSQAREPQFLRVLLERVLKLCDHEKVFNKFLKSPDFGSVVVNLFRFVASHLISQSGKCGDDVLEPYCAVLCCSVTNSPTAEVCLDVKDVEQILCVFKTSLETVTTQSTGGNILNHNILEFFCDVTEKVLGLHVSCWNLPVTEDLMTLFFDLCLSSGSLLLEDALHKKVQSIWRSSVKTFAQLQERQLIKGTFTCRASEKIHGLILNSEAEMLPDILENASLLITELYSEDDSSPSDAAYSLLSGVIEKILPSDKDWNLLQTDLSVDLLPTFVEKRLFYPLETCKIASPTAAIPSYMKVAYCVSELLMHCAHHQDTIGVSELHRENLKELLTEYIFSHLHRILWAFSYCESRCCVLKNDSPLHFVASALEKACSEMVAFLPKSDAFTLFCRLGEMDNSVQWCLPLYHMIEILKSLYPDDVSYLSCTAKNVEWKSSEKILIYQIIAHSLPSEEKVDLFRVLISEVLHTLDGESKEISECFGTLALMCCCCLPEVLNQTSVKRDLICLFKKLLQHVSSFSTREANYYTVSAQMAFLLSETVQVDASVLSSLWNPVLQFLSSTLKHLNEVKNMIGKDVPLLIYTHHCSSLLHSVLVLFDLEKSQVKGLSRMKAAFLKSVSKDLLNLFLGLSESCASPTSIPNGAAAFLTSLSNSTRFLSPEMLIDALFSEKQHHAQQEVVNSLEKLLPLLTSSMRPLQLGVHSIILKLMSLFAALIASEDEMESDEKLTGLNPLIETIRYTSDIVESMLLDFRVCDCCVVLPDTDSYTYTSAYLFAWNELFEFYSTSTPQERSACATFLENNNLLSSLLSNIFRLMPENPVLCCKTHEDMSSKALLKQVFCEPPPLSLSGPATAEELQHMVCSTYYSALMKFPAVVRMWWNNLDRNAADFVTCFTARYVSSLIAMEEIQAVNESSSKCNNMKIQARPASQEVVATYTVDGSSIELVIQLPFDYPIGPCSIERWGNVKLAQRQWRLWLKQLTAFLTYQNGSILDGLLLWKKNLDKKFDGVEECPICYFILHVSTAKLPNRSCSTCKKKFHADCMRKWFTTSNNSTCPLCRNLW